MLRRKVLTQILAIEGAILASFILAFAVIYESYKSLEQENLETNLTRIKGAFEREKSTIDRYTDLWASQGAVYFSIRNEAPITLGMRNMLTNSIVGGFEIDLTAIFNKERSLIIAKSLNPEGFRDHTIDASDPTIQLIQSKGLTRPDNLPSLGLITNQGSLLLVSAQSILNPLAGQKHQGTLVNVRHFDQEDINNLGEVVQQDVNIMPLEKFLEKENGQTIVEQLNQTSTHKIFEEIDNKTIGTYALIKDITGTENLILVMRTPRAIILQARDTLWAVGIALLLFFLFRVLYVLRFLDSTILHRLKDLSNSVKDLTAMDTLSQRLNVEGKDEISGLTRSFNGLLDALDNSQITLRNERDKAETTLASIGDSVITTDTAGQVTYMNKAALQVFPNCVGNYKKKALEIIFCPTDDSGLSDEINLAQRCIDSGESIRESNFCYLNDDSGEEIIIESLACPIYDSPKLNRKGPKLTGVVIVFRDVSHARRLQKNLIYQASHDGLTSLYNRSEFERQLNIVAHSAHKNNQNHHLIFIDLDRFKVVNDSCGHIAGDKVLKEIAQLMLSLIRKSDILARIGGDEFAIILMDCKFARAYDVAEKIRESIANFRFMSHDKFFTFGASIGFVNLKDEIFSNDTDLLSLADKACMAAKNSGRNRIHVYRSEDTQLCQHHEQTMWVTRVTEALEHDNFELYFQKIEAADNKNKSRNSAEILLRMIGANNEVIAPGSFLPAAERYGLMKFIDKWVIEHFCQWAQKNSAIFKELGTFSINLSGQSLSDAEFLNYLVDYFSTPIVAPEYICFEITETSAIQNIGNARQFINRLKKMGFTFSLDDFGSGMSSFSYLKHLEVDLLKIDGLFIKNMENEAIDHSMVRSINEIGHVMGIKTVAEFVETEMISDMVKELGIDYLQGYHIHKPAPLDSLTLAQKKLSGF